MAGFYSAVDKLTAGQAADAPMAEKLLSDVKPGATLLADKAYDTDAIRNFAKQRKCWANIPAKTNRKQTFSFNRWVYRQRNLVERFFNRIKQMRGLATRYDRRAYNYLAALKLAATRIWIASANESSGNLWLPPSDLKDGSHSGCGTQKKGSSHETLCRIGPVDGNHAGLHC